MKIYESAEDYLEAVLMLQEEHGFARSVEIAAKLNVSKPSVSVAVKRLRENGYLEMDSENRITLTPQGAAIANRVYSLHKMLTDFLMSLGVGEENARSDACKIEHDVSEETIEAIRRAVNQPDPSRR